jgi:alkanesulfonate monooxygenase SsuD/methylene tetrahydromethanopterin reductase-like flavin-dependent oxidoreductase (luciferase family)
LEFSSIVLTTYVDADSSPELDEVILARAIEEAVEFGRHGFHPWSTEHHFRGSWQSNPIQFLTHVAPRLPDGTHVGLGVLSVPFYHPVRLVEEMNLLDQLTKGRAVFGLGSGFPGPEPLAMGVDAQHHGSGRAARESVEVMERLWTYRTGDPPLEFDTGLHRGRVEKRVVPGAYRRVRPTIVRTARTEEATVAAARKGWPIFLGTPGTVDMDVRGQWQIYRAALAAESHPKAVVDDCLRWSTVDWLSVLVADNDDEAAARAAEAKAERLATRASFFARYRQGVLGPVLPGDVLNTDAFRDGLDMSDPVAGSPETVSQRVQEVVDLGINHVIVRFLGEWLGETRGLLERSLQLFAAEIAPRFREIQPLTDPLAVEAGAPRS